MSASGNPNHVRSALWTFAGGLAVFAAAFVWARSGPEADANIGAGILGLLGLVISEVGAVGFVVAAVVTGIVRLRSRRTR